MNIWLIQIGEPLPLDRSVRRLRTAMLADTLVARGHKVTWWASAFDHGSKKMLFPKDTTLKLDNGIWIEALEGLVYKKNFSLRRYIDHRIIAWKLRKRMKLVPKPDIIITSMPDYFTSWEAVKYAKSKNVPVLVDVRDEWPDIFLEFVPVSLKVVAGWLLKWDFKTLEYLFKNADGILSMMNQLFLWALKKAQRKATWKDQVFYLGASKFSHSSTNAGGRRFALLNTNIQDRFVVTFIGSFGKYYNPHIMIDAAKQLNERSPDHYLFIIAGDGKYADTLKIAAEAEKNVFFTGWVNKEEISYLLSVSSVGIIPCTESINAFPNKAFIYLSAGLPVIASVEGDLKDLVGKYNIGRYYKPNDCHQLVECIETISTDNNLYGKMRKNAADLFQQQLDAEQIYVAFAEHVEKVASFNKLSMAEK